MPAYEPLWLQVFILTSKYIFMFMVDSRNGKNLQFDSTCSSSWSSVWSSSAIAQKVAVSRAFEARRRHAPTGKLSLSTQQ